jgi:hypothetical protein
VAAQACIRRSLRLGRPHASRPRTESGRGTETQSRGPPPASELAACVAPTLASLASSQKNHYRPVQYHKSPPERPPATNPNSANSTPLPHPQAEVRGILVAGGAFAASRTTRHTAVTPCEPLRVSPFGQTFARRGC